MMAVGGRAIPRGAHQDLPNGRTAHDDGFPMVMAWSGMVNFLTREFAVLQFQTPKIHRIYFFPGGSFENERDIAIWCPTEGWEPFVKPKVRTLSS